MPTTAGNLGGVRFVDAGAVALVAEVTVPTVWEWARAGLVVVRRLPGRTRGRLRVAVDGLGFPVAPPAAPARPARRPARRR